MAFHPKIARNNVIKKIPGLFPSQLLNGIPKLIETSRGQVARTVNSAIVLLYWNAGKRIPEEVLQHKRAQYGE